VEERREKLAKILTVLSEYKDLSRCAVLDVGVGSGVITAGIARHAKKTVGLDVEDERVEKKGFDFVRVSSEEIPFPAASFDVVVSNHVIEHVPDAKKHLSEVHRVLKKDGICYLATPNKFFIDPHFRLPFIGFLPRSWSAFLVKTIRGRVFDIYPVGIDDIRRLAKGFSVEDRTFSVFSDPKRYAMKPLPLGVQRFLPSQAAFLLDLVAPSFIIVLKKH
jgi:2-polyprenyl-3-methyl-5-hydroxy-6-metoxy-1,4-benzoquinol methylase